MEEMNNQEEYELVRERIKTRPINRKKLFRRTVITAAMAVIFGVLACITFLVLEPVFSNMLTPEEEPVPDEIRIPLDEEETSPEDFILEDEEEPRTQIIYQETERTTTSIEDYQNLYNELYDLAKTCQKSLVTVTGVSQAVDWFNVQFWNQEGERAAQYLKKGSSVLCEGRVQIRDYTAKDGSKGKAIDVVGDHWEFAGSSGGEGQSAGVQGAVAAPQQVNQQYAPAPQQQAAPQMQAPPMQAAPQMQGMPPQSQPMPQADDEIPF